MHILTVQPITRGVLKDTLTYFSKDPATIGSVIFVPVRSQEVPALVVETQEVFDAKSTIKSSGYALRKIKQIKPLTMWHNAFIDAVQKTAHDHAQSFGETLLLLTPKTILDAYIAKELAIPHTTLTSPTHRPRVLAIQNSTDIRLESYQRHVRESFVRHESIFICAPTEQDVERIAETLRHGIEEYVLVFHSGLSKKRTLERWRSALKAEHAVLVVGTPQYLALGRHFSTIIIDEEHARGWKPLVRPFIDFRIFIETYARLAGSTLVLGAPILRAETYKRIKDGAIEAFERIAVHTQKNITTALIDPRIEEKALKEKTGKRTVQILTTDVRALIETAREKHQKVVLITARKGLAPITVCDDCGTVVRCTTCDNPLVIHHIKGREKSTAHPHKKTDARIFTCHTCGFVRVPEDDEHETCRSCGGWRLGALGIGTERIQEEVETFFPDTPHVIFDGEHITTRAQAKKCIAQFEKHPHSLLVGTPMAIPYLTKADHMVIISLDSLFAIPDFRITEHIFALVLALREKATSSLLVQTRADDTTLYTQALAGDLLSFSENELALRKAFAYPPYSTIIKIILRGTKKEEFPQKIATLKTFLTPFEVITPNTLSKEGKNTYRTHVILKRTLWPDEKLIAKLRVLPPEFTVEVNPDHLL